MQGPKREDNSSAERLSKESVWKVAFELIC